VQNGVLFFHLFLKLRSGVRQGGVLSPDLFAVYFDDIVMKVQNSNLGCHRSFICSSIFLYADDILLLAPSVHALQLLLKVCEEELEWLNMSLNVTKSMCLRIGPRYNAECDKIKTKCGHTLNWVDNCRYLGVSMVSARHFTCNFDRAKIAFYRAFNAIFGKINRMASEEVVLHLVQSKCLPVLLYGTEACPFNKSAKRSLEFPLTKICMKIFKTNSSETVKECQKMFNLLPIGLMIDKRKAKFLGNYVGCPNSICSTLCANDAKAELGMLCSAYSSRSDNELIWRINSSFLEFNLLQYV
jgi:hypothetical protein